MSGQTSAPPAGWYDAGTPGELRYWDGTEWSSHTAPASAVRLGPLRPSEAASGPPRVKRPTRNAWARLGLMLLLLVGLYLSAIVVAVIAAAGSTQDSSGTLLGSLFLVVVFGALATQVSFRKRDGWLILVPVYGVVWMIRIAWRVAFLPYRDWSPRPHEAADWVAVPGGRQGQ